MRYEMIRNGSLFVTCCVLTFHNVKHENWLAAGLSLTAALAFGLAGALSYLHHR